MDISQLELLKLIFFCYLGSVILAYLGMVGFELYHATTRYDVHAAFAGELLLVALVWFVILPIALVVWSVEQTKKSIERLANHIADKRGL